MHWTFEQRVRKLDQILIPKLEDAMRSMLVVSPSEYEGYLRPAKPALEVLIVGFEDSRMVIATMTYHLRRDGTIDSNVTPDDKQKDEILFFGQHCLIDQEKEKPGFESRIRANPVRALKHLVETEYSEEDVGPPIAITEFRNGKIKWIETGACEEK
jgi:hypothetical protein